MMDDFPIHTRFAQEARVGRGGSGDVFRARDRETGRTVALKRLGGAPEDPAILERFRREARLLAQIEDPHVVRYVAHGVDESGLPCLVVEWLEGEDPPAARSARGSPLRRRSRWPGRRRWGSTRCTGRASFTATSSPRTSTS